MRALPKREFSGTGITIPSAATALTATTVYLSHLNVVNTTGGTVTVAVKQGTGTFQVLSLVIPTAQSTSLDFTEPMKFAGGITWSSGQASGVLAEYFGWQEGLN